jgi:hypothetical protein
VSNYKVGKYVACACIGLAIFGAGVAMLLFAGETGIMKTLPYVLIGIGCGVFGGNTGTAISNSVMRKSPEAARKAEIEARDERNTAIRNRAKAKSYDLMIMVFGALLLALALMNADLYLILGFVAAYLFVIGTNVYYHVKYSKEM